MKFISDRNCKRASDTQLQRSRLRQFHSMTVTLHDLNMTMIDGYYQYLGTTSLKVENPTSENNSAFFTGFAHQFKETTFNGKDVTFSAYVKTKNVKQIYSGGSVGAILKVKCLDSSGKTVKEINSIGLTGTLD